MENNGSVVDDVKRQRRFQFSLRKLMLWMAVMAAWLSVLRLINAGVVLALVTTLWLAVFVLVRLKWGTERGGIVATFATGIGVTAIVGVGIGLRFCLRISTAGLPQWSDLLAALAALAFVVVGFLVLGTLAGLYTFLVVDLIMRFVNWLDGLLQTETPQDRAEQEQP